MLFRDQISSSSCFDLFASLLSVILSFYLLAVVDGLCNLYISIFFQFFLSCHFQEFSVFLVKLFCNKLGCLSIYSLVACRLTIEFTEILLLILFSFFPSLSLNFSLGIEDRLDFFFEVLEKAPETKYIKIFFIMLLKNSLVCFCNISEFGLGIRRRVIFWVVFESQLSICLFDLVEGGILADFQNFVRIEFFSGTLREKLLEKFFFSLIFQLVFFKKPFEGVMGIKFFKHIIGLGDRSVSVASGVVARPEDPPEREDSITEIMERSKQIFLHNYSFLIILYFGSNDTNVLEVKCI